MVTETTTIAGVEISRADKVLFPDDRLTKADLAQYYADVAETMLPHLEQRAVNMQRFPDGIGGSGFYEKKVPRHFPDWVETVEVTTSDGKQRQVVAGDTRTLVFLADQACVTPHTWLSRIDALDRPDQLIFDLDPSADDIDAVRHAAAIVGEVLDEAGLHAYLKTTGSKGYHVHVPLAAADDFDAVRDFARAVGRLACRRQPDLLTMEHRKDKRGSRVYVDVMRNAYGQTAVPAYAVRARPGAPVATPIDWDELTKVTPDRYTIASVRRRLAQRTDPWHDIGRHAQSLDEARVHVQDAG